MTRIAVRASIGALLLLTLTPAPASAEPAARRWAVIASPQLRAEPALDLVLAELSSTPGIQLVERQQIDLIAGEAQTTAILGSPSLKARIDFGRSIGADRLVLLFDEIDAGRPRVRVLITDCTTGARLMSDLLPAPTGAPGSRPQFARDVIATIQRTNARFAGGVKGVIGVTPFESKDLSHDHDDLQASAAVLVSNALAEVPGVAVIELDEARAIRDERAIADGAPLARITPVIVQGEYAYAPPRPGEPPRVSFSVTLDRGVGAKPPTIQRKSLLPAEAIRFLSGELPREILQATPGAEVRPMTLPEQYQSLVQGADRMSRVGAWELSIRLRNAALLVKPDDADEQRVALIQETSRWLRQGWPFSNVGAIGGPIALDSSRGRAWRGATEDLEYLLRNRRLDREAALALTLDLGRASALVAKQRTQMKWEYLRTIFPLLLPPGEAPDAKASADRLDYLSRWVEALVYLALEPGCYAPSMLANERIVALRTVDLVAFASLLDELHPADPVISTLLVRQLTFVGQDPREKLPELHAFYSKLAGSKKQPVALYGRYGLFWHRWLVQKQAAETMLPDAEVFQKDVHALLGDRKSALRDQADDLVRVLRVVIDGKLNQLLNRALPTPTPRAVPEAPNLEHGKLAGRVRYKQLKFRQNDVQITYIRHVPCGPRLDVFWEASRLIYRKASGQTHAVPLAFDARVADAVWDGECLWVATLAHGVCRYDADGKFLDGFGAGDGLPSCDSGIRLYPLGVGKVLAVGAFGRENRAWCALLERTEQAQRNVKPFHQARHSTSWVDADASVLLDPELAFRPLWIRPLQRDATGAAKSLLVGRFATPAATPRYPLRIDLPELRVGVADLGLKDIDPASINFEADDFAPPPQEFHFLPDGSILHAFRGVVRQHAPAGKRLADGSSSRIVFAVDELMGLSVAQYLGGGKIAKPYITRIDRSDFASMNQLIGYQGAIYAPGPTWVKLDPATLGFSRYADDKRDLNSGFRYGVSDVLGLIMFNELGQLWQVEFVEN